MSKARIVYKIIDEYGIEWGANRALYSAKLKMLELLPRTEKLFEKHSPYPTRLDLFAIDVNQLSSFLKERLSADEQTMLIYTANNACKGIINGFSSVELDYGYPIDWQLNPLTGRRYDEKVKWYRIPDFDKKRGDIKAVWEASRFSHFITLARAYLLAGDDKYYFAFHNQLKSWLERNLYNCGANFKCGQECSLRMVNALLAFTIFRNAGIATDADASCMKDLIDRCYRKVLSNFFYAYKCIKNNHTLSELMGMIVGAWCCGDDKRLKTAYTILDKVISEQFMSDGGYRQFSFNYQRLALNVMECVMSISSRTRIQLSDQSKKRILNSAKLLYQCQDESNDVPNYGPNDGALIFSLTSCGYRDFRPVINTIFALLEGKRLYPPDIQDEELIWFGINNAKLLRIDVAKRESTQFLDAGLFTLRGKRAWAMIILNNYTSRPAHLDQLHFDLWAKGVNVFCDQGTYSYASDLGKQLASNVSHNTLGFEKKSQMNTMGPFLVYDWAQRSAVEFTSQSFRGIMISKNGYEHERTVIMHDNQYSVIDAVRCAEQRQGKILFYTKCNVELDNNVAHLLTQDGTEMCTLSSDHSISVCDAQSSLFYMKAEKIHCISIAIDDAGSEKIIHTKIKVK